MLGTKVNFKKAKTPLSKKILGDYVVLEPINPTKHVTQLFNNFYQDKKNTIWNYFPYGPFKNIKDFKKWLLNSCMNKDPFFYAIYAKRHKQYCGMASYLRITPEHGSIEVGHINYSPLLQNTVEGTETMYLMMSNAFDQLGNRRYEWKCNNLNNASKKAALRLGFTYEGLFRQMNVFKGRNRDTAWFSIIDSEWKNLRKRYQKYLITDNFDQNFIQKQKL
ncbi:MAG: GNAT family N-acetyltransferase [Pelagibacteraceae bacterium]|nr:GNAT family N-acetyltransferase [Pelagibacteraceae bacterium]MBT4645823.1 GNAT family N-acetyltransferase [Pelagibacteraceae bacterium]MBT5214120.1 GNAT family N-acetyltransferase [Pelagibacteraceae bacterium]MBT6198015.1 GNAT family N-acetyltransferase [Pelagibacteraceae bacterium]MBT6689235.1 GNAT family N-acetyltransferase [Flavobacteriaceae bacterium]